MAGWNTQEIFEEIIRRCDGNGAPPDGEAPERLVLCTIVSTRGSCPQEAGAKMIVLGNGKTIGTLGGGCVEAEVRTRASQMLLDDRSGLLEFNLNHDYGWDDGMICGGVLEIQAQSLDASRIQPLRKIVQAVQRFETTELRLPYVKDGKDCEYVERIEPPPTLLDYLPPDALVVIDESHQTVPQVRGMYHGDRSRKEVLVAYGFRLPSALDNRPLNFEEWEQRVRQMIFVSATPGPYELAKSQGVVVEQIIRPTGLIDPPIDVRPVKGQVDDLLQEIRTRVAHGERVLVTTLTKRMAEDLTQYYQELGVKVRYLHSDIETLERVQILRGLRRGEFDVLVGINLLREGLDLPEVSLVAILDADKEGFLRSAGSLIQTSGRAARNINGRVIMYADKVTDSMRAAMAETGRRRTIQQEYNEANGITPQSIVKAIDDVMSSVYERDYVTPAATLDGTERFHNQQQLDAYIASLQSEMRAAAANLDFEKAATLRDDIRRLRNPELGLPRPARRA
jgi:hypothetical protein